jgi:hypothetical protein
MHPATLYILCRDVTVEECPWLPRDFAEGEVVFPYHGATYGVITPSGVAATLVRGETPFFEFPAAAVRSAWESDPPFTWDFIDEELAG